MTDVLFMQKDELPYLLLPLSFYLFSNY